MSNIVDLSNQQALMDVDGPLSQMMYTHNNQDPSAMDQSGNINHMQLHNLNDAVEILKFLIINGNVFENPNIDMNQYQLADSVIQELISLAEKYEKDQDWLYLTIEVINSYNLYLHFIDFVDGTFKIINGFSFEDANKRRKQAYIVLNGNKTMCGPLFHLHLGERPQAVFDTDDIRIGHYVDAYIGRLNRTDIRDMSIIEENSSSTTSHGSSTDSVSSSSNDLDPAGGISTQNQIGNYATGDDIVQQIAQTSNILPIPKTISSSIQEPEGNTYHFDRIPETYPEEIENDMPGANNDPENTDEFNHGREADQIPSSSISPQLSTATQVPQTLSGQYSYEKPTIAVEPKEVWTTRHPKDLILKAKKKSGKKENQFIGLLQGVGRQRSQIQVKVPSRKRRRLYLAIAVRTVNNEQHSLKVIVPGKTRVNKDTLNRRNNLNYLEFNECDSAHFFDPNTRNVYMRITLEEHRKQRKKVPIHMFNLYQNQHLTKAMIEREQLEKCQLAFWLCEKSNGNYIPISHESLSRMIVEKKKKKLNKPS